jgi:FAD/FMN-containing dehydrogenase
VLAEFDESEAGTHAFASLAAQGLVTDGILGQSEAQNAELWRLREGITESIARYGPYKNDVAVRVGDVTSFLERAQALLASEYADFEVLWFGHLGDGNLHVSILPPKSMTPDKFQRECERVTELLCGVLERFGGTVSAEHGIGLLKRPYLHHSRSNAEVELMHQMKRVFDPAGILNPGKLFPP